MLPARCARVVGLESARSPGAARGPASCLRQGIWPEQLGGGESGTWGGPHRIDRDQLCRLLTRGGFGGVEVGIRTFVDHFRDIDEMIEFGFGALNEHGYHRKTSLRGCRLNDGPWSARRSPGN